MKMKDLKPGMVVALRASTYYEFAPPSRCVVLSTEFNSGPRFSRATDGERVEFRVTAEDTGEEVVAEARVFRYGNTRQVLLAAYGTGPADKEFRTTQFVTPAQIEGPYAPIRDMRAERRKAQEERKAERERTLSGLRMRQREARNRLVALGVSVDTTARENMLAMTLEQAEALADRLEGTP